MRDDDLHQLEKRLREKTNTRERCAKNVKLSGRVANKNGKNEHEHEQIRMIENVLRLDVSKRPS